jgi:hypothetical protein
LDRTITSNVKMALCCPLPSFFILMVRLYLDSIYLLIAFIFITFCKINVEVNDGSSPP